jgi:hypothetical protein
LVPSSLLGQPVKDKQAVATNRRQYLLVMASP